MKTEFKIGQKVLVKDAGWCGKGTPESPLNRCDLIGEVVSIKGITPGHTNVHKYMIDCKKAIVFSNGDVPEYGNSVLIEAIK